MKKKWVHNILAQYERATDADKVDGGQWYPRVKARCETWALRFNVPLQSVVGAYAVLSPGTTWALNERDTVGVLEHGEAWRTSTYNSNRLKALHILRNGKNVEDVTTKRALKVRAFFRAIMGDTSAVCVDRHASAIAYGRPLTDKERGRVALMKAIAEAYQAAANVLGLTPRELQAITWTAYRRNLDKKLAEISPF